MGPKIVAVVTLLAGGILFSVTNFKKLGTVEFVSKEWRSNHTHEDLLHSGSADTKIDINEFLIGVIENFRLDMLTGIPELKVPVLDPFQPKKPATVNVEDAKASVHGNFTDISVEGFSGFELENLHADLHNLTLQFQLRIPQIKANGNYSITGKIIKIIPLRGNGEFRIESHNLSLAAKASIENSEDDRLQLSVDFDVEIDFEKVELHLENFLGGGRWTEVLLNVVNDISKDLFKKFLPLLRGELNKALLKVINKHLKKVPITSIIPSSNANEYVDQILTNVRIYIKEKNLDPMQLPDYTSNFTKKVVYVNFHGETKLYDGWMSGISSLHRTNDCELKTNRTTISVTAHLGLKDLELFYKGHAKFMSWGPTLLVGGSVREVEFYFQIEQSNRKGAKPKLKEFEIIEMSTIWIDLSGLGPLTWLMKWILTGMSKFLEDFVVNKVTYQIRGFMESEFQKLSFPV